MEPKCKCPVLDAHDICNLYREVRYLVNFKSFKFCLKRIPESFREHIVTPSQYFRECLVVNLF